MAIEPTKPLYVGEIVMGDGADLPSLSGGTLEDQQMQAAHTQGVVAIQSIDQRVELAVSTTIVLGEKMLEGMGQLAASSKRLTAGCDPNDQTDADTLHFAHQLRAKISVGLQQTIEAQLQKKIGMAGSDVRKAIKPPPLPPPAPPPPVIVQQTGPRIRPKRPIADIGRPTFVIDEE